ncbi:MAG: RsiV family protein [Porphyromonas sp.]|nr:RsiV family protein [Porphyromonas sp.]
MIKANADRKILLAGLFVLILITALSCRKSKQGETELNDQIQWSRLENALSYTHPVIEEAWTGIEDEKPIFWSHLDILLPDTKSAKLKEAVERISNTLVQNLLSSTDTTPIQIDDHKHLTEELLNLEVEEYVKDMGFYLERRDPGTELYYPLFIFRKDVHDTLLYNDLGLVSIGRLTQSYAGGATHETDFMETLNFSLKSGEQISPSSLFIDIDSKSLKELIQKGLINYFGVERAEDLVNQGLFIYEQEELFVPVNFFFDKETLHLYFNPYEIGIHALSSIDIELPYSALEPYLQPQFDFLIGE